MNKNARIVRRRIVLIAVVLLLAAAACVPRRDGVSWADLTVVGEEPNQQILISYNDYIVLIDPAVGVPAQLRSSDGTIRTDENNNPRRWEIDGEDTKSQFFTSPVWLTDDIMLITDYNGKLFTASFSGACLSNRNGACIDTPSGIEIPGKVLADPTEGDGKIFIPFSEHDVIAVDAETFEELWQFETGRGVWSSPIYMDDVVYITTTDHHMFALNADSGDKLWELEFDGAVGATPAYADGYFYFGTFDHDVLKVSTDGEIAAEYEAEGWVWGTPALFEEVLYITDMKGYLYALNPDDLSEIFKIKVGDEGIRPGPLVTEDYVIVVTRNGHVYWIDRVLGTELFERDIDAEVLSEPIMITREGETLIVFSSTKGSKTLVAFNLDGQPRWTYER